MEKNKSGDSEAATAAKPIESDTHKVIDLDCPIKRDGQTITQVTVRKPQSGELRGVSLLELAQLNVDALISVIPRVTSPMIHKEEVAKLEPADLMQIGAEVAGFLVSREARLAFRKE